MGTTSARFTVVHGRSAAGRTEWGERNRLAQTEDLARSRVAERRSDGSVEGLVLDVDRFASHDGPGIRTTVFLKGCPLSCTWCHSPESQLARPELLYQAARCNGCWACIPVCPEGAIRKAQPHGPVVSDLESPERPGRGLDRASSNQAAPVAAADRSQGSDQGVDLASSKQTGPVTAVDRVQGSNQGMDPAPATGATGIVEIDRDRCTHCGTCAEACYPGALRMAGQKVRVDELVGQIARDAPYFEASGGGVTLSGGEPARQLRFAYHFLLACQDRGIHTAMETTGYARWQAIEALAEVTDLFLYDVKFIDGMRHRDHTGVPNHPILENLKRLAAMGANVQVRVPCIAGINDGPQQIQDIARTVSEAGLHRIALLPYNAAAGAKYDWLGRDYPHEGVETQSDEYMHSLEAICREEDLSVQIGG